MHSRDFNSGAATAARLLAHEIRRPLTTMELFLRILERQTPSAVPPQALAACQDIVRRSKDRLSGMLTDLMLLDPALVAKVQDCDLAAVVLAAAAAAGLGHNELHRCFDHQGSVLTDADRLVRVLVHLFWELRVAAPGAVLTAQSFDRETAEGGCAVVLRLSAGGEPDRASEPGGASPLVGYPGFGALGLEISQWVIAALGGTLARFETAGRTTAIDVILPAGTL